METTSAKAFAGILIGSFACLAAQAVRAADLAPASSTPYDWSGPSLGLSFSNLWGEDTVNVPGFAKLSALNLNGPAVGLTFGYDYSVAPGFILGGAADYNVSAAQFNIAIPSQSLTVRDSQSWALRGRLGVDVGSDTLAYGTVGFSQLIGDAKLTGDINAQSGRQTDNGLVVGLGLETRFDTNMFIRAEFLHGIYAKQTYASGAFSVTPTTDTARLTLVIRPTDGAAVSARLGSTVDWNGFHIGAMAGWENTNFAANGAGSSISGIGGSGVSAAAVAGFDTQQDRSVAGVEGEFSANAGKGSLSDTSGDRASVSIPYEIAARARFGDLLTPSTLLYGAVGVALTQATALATLGGATASGSRSFTGVQFGMGMETMLTPHIGARVEYLETHYSKSDYLTPSTGKTQTGLIYRF